MNSKQCASCNEAIEIGTTPLVGTDQNASRLYHKHCARCAECDSALGQKKWCISYSGGLYCDTMCVSNKTSVVLCNACGMLLDGEDMVRSIQKRFYHMACIVCSICNVTFKTGQKCKISSDGGSIICKSHCKPKTPQKKRELVRTNINPTQLSILNRYFVRTKYPNNVIKDQIRSETDLCLGVIKNWFQNRRARTGPNKSDS